MFTISGWIVRHSKNGHRRPSGKRSPPRGGKCDASCVLAYRRTRTSSQSMPRTPAAHQSSASDSAALGATARTASRHRAIIRPAHRSGRPFSGEESSANHTERAATRRAILRMARQPSGVIAPNQCGRYVLQANSLPMPEISKRSFRLPRRRAVQSVKPPSTMG